MPRTARKKQDDAVYHIMVRSISEVQLFKSDIDKKKYMLLIKEYQSMYNFRVYAYCLMSNHAHLIVDCNGADVSKIMHCINFKYAMYYNAVYKRHGHLFQDRFKSKIVTDNRYLITLSAYIHNNPLDIKEYENTPEDYYYSSLGVYLNLRADEFNILDKKFILSILGKNNNEAKQRYMGLVFKSKDVDIDNFNNEEAEFIHEQCEYRSERTILIRNVNTEDIIKYVVDKFKIEKPLIYLKHQKKITPAKGILALLLRKLCNVSCKDICSLLGNITSSRVSKLSTLGINLISSDEKYKNIVNDFMICYC